MYLMEVRSRKGGGGAVDVKTEGKQVCFISSEKISFVSPKEKKIMRISKATFPWNYAQTISGIT